ncbi:MAG: 16S rRNA (adenine(1518)-N(6)/adenine(1519)-N(6))-dimethyltransferase RsmA [Actinobacteria bacterium]|nr:16S rRNA (adenine(1518)-N(6)/adenine(1519)-N(6))-dimethyltransferase RsmA [Actinomycetota bacterium]
MTVPGAGRLRALFDKHGARPTKALGQNFVIDPNTINKVVSIAGVGSDDDVLELGAGAGSLTAGLAAVARSVVAIELDASLLPVLREVASAPNVTIVEGDALDIDLSSFRANKLVGNLPYNSAAHMVIKTLEDAPGVRTLTVMIQKEVGERLVAQPGTDAYSVASVLVRYFADARIATRISRNIFWPVPNVDSVLVSIVRREGDAPCDYQAFRTVVRAGFTQRRKTLRNTMALVTGDAARAEEWIAGAGLDPSVRAETVGLDGFVALARLIPRTS